MCILFSLASNAQQDVSDVYHMILSVPIISLVLLLAYIPIEKSTGSGLSCPC